MKNKIIIISIIALLVLVIGAWHFFSPKGFIPSKNKEENDPGNIVAIVNEEEISQNKFNSLQEQIVAEQGINLETLDEQAQEQFQTQVMNNLISQVLLRQTVENSDIDISQEEVESQMQMIKSQFDSDAAFEEALSAQETTEENLRSQINSELSTQAYLNQELSFSSIEATEEEVVSTYEQIAANQEVPPLEEVRDQVEQIVIQQKKQNLINELIEKLRAEADIEIFI